MTAIAHAALRGACERLGEHAEAPENVTLKLRRPEGGAALGARTTALLVIKDDEPVVQLASATYTVVEGNMGFTALKVVLTRTRGSDCYYGCSVLLGTGGITATYGDDYFTLDHEFMYFAARELTRTITYQIVGDWDVEGPETFRISILSANGMGIGPRSDAIVTIRDNDR
jgi:hypothetical protein